MAKRTACLLFLFFALSFLEVLPAAANPMKGECRGLYRDYLKESGFRSFASRKDKSACGWAAGRATQAKADEAALGFCRKHGKCYILTSTVKEQEAKLNRRDVKSIQNALNKLGFKVGTADGQIGPATRRGIKAFQGSINVNQTGFLSEGESKYLLKRAGEAGIRSLSKPLVATRYEQSRDLVFLEADAARKTFVGLNSNGSGYVWDALSGKTLVIFDATDSKVSAIAIDADGRFVIYAREDASLTRIDLSNGSQKSVSLEEPAAVAAVGSSARYAQVGFADGRITEIDFDTQSVVPVGDISSAPRKMAYANEAQQMLVLSKDARFYVTGARQNGFLDFFPLQSGGVDIKDFALGGRGKTLAVLSGKTKIMVFVQSAGAWSLRNSFDTNHPVINFDIEAKRNEIAVVSSRRVEIYDATLGSVLKDQVFKFSTSKPKNVSFAADDGRFAATTSSKELKLLARGGDDLLTYRGVERSLKSWGEKRRKNSQKTARAAKQVKQVKINRAKALFDSRKCVEFAKVEAEFRSGNTVDDCTTLARKDMLADAIKTALFEKRCDRAFELDREFNEFASKIEKCRAVAKREGEEKLFVEAMQAGDCEAVAKLATALGKKEAESQCRFNVAISTKSSRKMYLAAARYDAAGETSKAQLLYSEIMDQFSEDDLALQAAIRLTTLKDLERSEQARRESEAEMARLKREAENAQRAAEQARRKAEQRAAAATASKRPRNTACRHVYPGKYFRISQRKMSNAKDFLGGMLFAGAMGNHFHVQGVNPAAGVATACSSDTGKCLEFKCSSIP